MGTKNNMFLVLFFQLPALAEAGICCVRFRRQEAQQAEQQRRVQIAEEKRKEVHVEVAASNPVGVLFLERIGTLFWLV